MKIVYIYLLMAVTALAAVTSCSKEGAPTGVAGPIDVRLVVSDGNGTRVGSDATDNYIHQLRVYAFIGDEKVGYAEADNLSDRNYIPMTLSKIGRINFYVIANDKFGPNPKKQKEDGTWESLTKSDWKSLTKEELESLKFDLTRFNGWTPINGDFVSPMSNNPCNEFGVEFTGENTNNYTSSYTIDSQNIPATGSLVIPVTVQHVLGRLRLMLNKEESDDDVTITLTRAEVYHRPDAFRLYFGSQESVDDVISFNNNQTANDKNQELVESLIGTEQPLVTKPADGYTTVARTYLAPNQHGTYDKTGGTFTTSEGTITETGKDKAYRLELTVKFDYGNHTETKNYTVYLPRVPRNTSIDVQGTFKGSTDVKPEFNIMVNAWVEKNIDIPEFL